MLRLLLGFWFLMLSVVSSLANEVRVLSGEHNSFTRLTFSVPDGLTYDVGLTNQMIQVDFNSTEKIRFKTEKIFDRISRDRISDIRVEGDDSIEIALACNCEFNSFFQPPGLLVIDVRPVANRSTEIPVPKPAARPAISLPRRTDFTTDGTSEIAAAIARNMTRGLLETSDPSEYSRSEPVQTVFDGADIPSRNISLPPDTGAVLLPSLSAKPCRAIHTQPLPDVALDKNYYETYGAMIGRLYRESGEIDGAAVLELARLQAAYGLAAEALSTLRLSPSLKEDAHFIRDFAMAIARKDNNNPGQLRSYKHCSNVAMLATILSDTVTQIPGDEASAILVSLEEISRPLLKVVGPRVTEALLSSGLKDAAQDSIRIRNRAFPNGARSLADANAAKSEEEKQKIIETIARSNASEAVDAAVTLVNQAKQNAQAVSEPDTDLVSTLAFENRRTSAAETIAKAEIYALATRAQFDEAFNRLDVANFGDIERAQATSFLFEELVKSSSDVVFLKHTISRVTGATEVLDNGAKQAVAKRLFETGFGHLAKGILTSIKDPEATLLTTIVASANAGDEFEGIPEPLLEAIAQVKDPQVRYELALLKSDMNLAVRVAPQDRAGHVLNELLQEPSDASATETENATEATIKASSEILEQSRELSTRIASTLKQTETIDIRNQ